MAVIAATDIIVRSASDFITLMPSTDQVTGSGNRQPTRIVALHRARALPLDAIVLHQRQPTIVVEGRRGRSNLRLPGQT